jgi:hypothetical protein
MVGQDRMDTIHRKLDPRGRDPCARSVRTSPEITGHETSGRDPGRGYLARRRGRYTLLPRAPAAPPPPNPPPGTAPRSAGRGPP